MKSKNTYKVISVIKVLFLMIILWSCDDSEELKTSPMVTFGEVTNVTLSSADLSATITENGNSNISEAGFVYSSVVNQPTVADNKVKGTTKDKTFTAILSGLASGTVYHIRAYAINEIGIAYSDIKDFSTGNSPPEATNILIDGVLEVSKEVTAVYSYRDAENDTEGATTFQWYSANDAGGAGEVVIAGATLKSFLIGDAQDRKFLRVAVTPNATTGTATGSQVTSVFMGAVGEATTVTFTYNGSIVTYGIITRPSGRKWMDRNLGAKQAAEKIDDYLAFGDSFQWGRLADGHQQVDRTGKSAADATGVTGITSTSVPYATSSEDAPTTNQFIIDGGSKGDWRDPQKDGLWQGVTGVNNPCPDGWKIPTKTEWEAEGLTSGADAFQKMKLPYTGLRWYNNGGFDFVDYGFYWTSTIENMYAPQLFTYNVFFDSQSFFADITNRGNGNACRCIKE